MTITQPAQTEPGQPAKRPPNPPHLPPGESIYQLEFYHPLRIKFNPTYRSNPPDCPALHSPAAAYQVLQAIYATLNQDQEHFILLALNCANDLRCYHVVASGEDCAVTVDMRLIFRVALLAGAKHLIVAHNHPSNRLHPSPDDLLLTKALVVAGQFFGIDVYDHILYGEQTYTSLRQAQPQLFALE